MRSRHSLGATVRLTLDIVAAGAGVISQSPGIAIQRRADGKWFQASDGTWQTTIVVNDMTQTDSVNLAGRYHFDFDQSLDLLANSIEYIVRKKNAAGTLITEYEDLVFGVMPSAMDISLCSVQGRILDGSGTGLPGAIVRATVVPVVAAGLGRAVQSDRVLVAHTNGVGDFDMPLVRGSTCRLEIPSIGYDRKIVVPDLSSVLFTVL